MTLVKGTLLYTKNGAEIGNAIIIDVLTVIKSGEDCFAVHTDFGNTTFLSKREIDDFFVIGSVTNLEMWQRDRFNARIATIVQPNTLTAKS
jgi:hypothetical protein